MTKQMVDVTQADREAAAPLAGWDMRNYGKRKTYRDGIRKGEHDRCPEVEALAAHRIQSTADLQAKLDMAVDALDDIRATPNSLPLSGAVMRKIAVDALAAIKGE